MGIEYILTSDGELYHWGTKGMKWGRRLYQNKDGSLTPLGKKRYAKEEATLKEREKVIKNREREAARRAKMDAKKADLDAREAALNGSGKKSDKNSGESTKQQKKSIKDMSDVELNEAIQRARLEDTYRNLRPEPVAKPGIGTEILTNVVKPALMNSGKKALEAVIDKSVKDLLKDKVDPNSIDALKKTAEKLELQRKIAKLKKGEDPNEKPLSWEDKLKKQQWEMKEEERRNGKSDTAKPAPEKAKSDTAKPAPEKAKSDTAKPAPEKAKADYESWKEGLKERNEKKRNWAELSEQYKTKSQEAKKAELVPEDKKAEAAEKAEKYNTWKENTIERNRTEREARQRIEDWFEQVKEYDEEYGRAGESYVQTRIDWDAFDEWIKDDA